MWICTGETIQPDESVPYASCLIPGQGGRGERGIWHLRPHVASHHRVSSAAGFSVQEVISAERVPARSTRGRCSTRAFAEFGECPSVRSTRGQMIIGPFGPGRDCHRRRFARHLSTSLSAPPERMCGHRTEWPHVAVVAEEVAHMRGRKNPPLEIVSVPEGAPLTFDTMAQAYLEDYVLQRYRTLTTARGRVEHLRGFFGGWRVEAITPDSVRNYQMHRRRQGAEAATVNRETSALSRMFQLAIRRGQLERMPLFPKRLEENPPRDGFFEHEEYLKVRSRLPQAFQDVLDFAYYSGWRRNEILGLTWDEVDLRVA